MKFRTKLLMLVLIPLIIIAIGASLTTDLSVRNLIADDMESTMLGMAAALRSTYEAGAEGEYRLDEATNEAWKGDSFNISQSPEAVDAIKAEMGAEATFFYGDTRYMTTLKDASGARIIGTKTSDENVKAVVLGEGRYYFDTNLIINGSSYYAMYLPVFQTGTTDPVGMTFIGILRDTMTSGIMKTILIIFAIILLIVALSVIITLILSTKLSRSLKHGADTLEALAGGNLTVNVSEKECRGKDEVSMMMRSVAELRDSLRTTITGVAAHSKTVSESSSILQEMAKETATSIEQVERAVSDIALGATSQADETSKASGDVVAMGTMIQETVREAETLRTNASSMNKSGEQAMDTLLGLKSINEKAISAIDVIYEQTNMTNVSALKIKEATDLITSIADETNLLSLNASIEAARAGEMGRGFAVVADQIQKLADQSSRSAEEIEKIILVLIAESNKAVNTMQDVKRIMQEQTEKVDNTAAAFGDVKDGIDHSIKSIKLIADRTEDLDRSRISVVDVVQSLTAIAEENAATTEETSAATAEVSSVVEGVSESAAELKRVAAELSEAVGSFKLE